MNSPRSLLVCSLAAAALLADPVSAGAAAEQPKPNVLFIVVDDLNDWIGALGGHPGVKTPNLDRLAAQGELFTRAYCPAPACGPSRAAVLTGLRPSTTGLYRNDDELRQNPVLKEAVALPEYLGKHGYYSMGAGKIFHDPDPKSWKEYWPSMENHRQGDPHVKAPPAGSSASFVWGPLDVNDSDMGDWQVADWVIEKLERPTAEPFFLACGIFRPHLPWAVPRKYFDMYPLESIVTPAVKADDLDDVPPVGREMAFTTENQRIMENQAWAATVQAYLASITFADACVGRVLDALDRSPAAKNTIVVLWSDNGWHLGEKQHWRKFSLWEEATRTVLILKAPGLTKPGIPCNATVNLIDLFPTIVELCGLPPKEGVEGVSLLPLIQNPEAPWDRPSLSTYHFNNHSVRSTRWRYTRYADGGEELYDHDADPNEWTNLAGDSRFPDVKKDLARWMPAKNAPESVKVKGQKKKSDE